MPDRFADSTSLWLASTSSPAYAPLDRDLHVDVVVIGGGITGVTAAYLLKQAGRTVALVERARCGRGETGHTTAHLTAVTDVRLSDLVERLGIDHAQAVWDAGFAAIARIRSIVRDERINCQFDWVQGWLHASPDADLETARIEIGREAEVANSLGIDATYVENVPGVGRPGVVFESQARFHPLSYLAVLTSRIHGEGSFVFEETTVDAVDDEPLAVRAGANRITTDYVVIATHVPLMSAMGKIKESLLQTDLFPYSTYAVSGVAPCGSGPEGLFWEHTSGPYEFLRIDRKDGQDHVILGGEDHKTGQAADTRKALAALDRRLRERVPGIEIRHRWSGQVIETRDGLPYIGETGPGRFAATGYAGNGMTFGTLGGMMAADAALGRTNPWTGLFDINRRHLLTGAWNYLRENKDYPYYLIRDRFTGVEGRSLRAVPRGGGRIVAIDGVEMAAYRDADGVVTKLSPTCTHMGCRVAWNQAAQSWDCPCHGSRYSATGEVIAGPAERPLGPPGGRPSDPTASPISSGSRRKD